MGVPVRPLRCVGFVHTCAVVAYATIFGRHSLSLGRTATGLTTLMNTHAGRTVRSRLTLWHAVGVDYAPLLGGYVDPDLVIVRTPTLNRQKKRWGCVRVAEGPVVVNREVQVRYSPICHPARSYVLDLGPQGEVLSRCRFAQLACGAEGAEVVASLLVSPPTAQEIIVA
jgi:hypothetical protein